MSSNITAALKQNTDLYKHFGMNYVALFGSYARGDQQPLSDVDILVDFDEPKSFFELADVKFSLEKIVGQDVDLVTKKSLKKALIPSINKNLVLVYEKR